MRRLGVLWNLVIVAVAVAAAVWHPPALWVEQVYANQIYPQIDSVMRAAFEQVPFAVGDALFVVALIILILSWVLGWRSTPRGDRVGRALRLALGTVAFVGAVYIAFLDLWAFNYGRVPLEEKVVTHNDRVNEDTVTEYANGVARHMNADAAAAHREHLTDAQTGALIEPTFEQTIARLGDEHTFHPPPIKPTIFDGLMRASATLGFTDPWTHEVNLASTLLPFERPASYAHEWGHVSGFADESEANYISVLSCTRSSDALVRYSGWLLVWFNLPGDIHVSQGVTKQVAADIDAIKRRYQAEVKPAVADAQRKAYDSYLKANRVKAGYDSYRLFVRWMVGADYGPDGLPVVRTQESISPHP